MLFRIYLSEIKDQIILDQENSKYLIKSLRLKLGDKFEVVSGTMQIVIYQIINLARNKLTAKLIETYPENNEPSIRLTLAQALPKTEKLELILQKCTELGVYEFNFFESDKTPVKIKNLEKKLDRWHKIIESAICQSRRNHLPQIKVFASLESVLATQPENIFYADPEAIQPLSKNKPTNFSVFIGPESGFSKKELFLLQEHGQGFSLGKRILRTETAAIGVCAKILL